MTRGNLEYVPIKKERWMELCEQASTEHDPQQLLILTEEIIGLLDEKEPRPKHLQTTPPNLSGHN
jgi:hypothetical protein